jgi:alkyl sulfatase BDS1-like metallo-beta-lactamase superfamily hydrolase
MAQTSREGTDDRGHTAPTEFTVKANTEAAQALPEEDFRDSEDARKGWLAGEDELRIVHESQTRVWDQAAYGFIHGTPPSSVHPGLWRQAQLNNIHGLFEVTPGIYQVRGYDLANLTIIQGKTGWIVVDPLTCRQTAEAALALAGKHLGARPVSALVFTHSHIDHFGGSGAAMSGPHAPEKPIRIVAPLGFMEESISESVLAGTAMRRRAQYMYGRWLQRSERGHVDTGLGKEPAIGDISILAPTDLVDQTPREMDLDGIRFVFQHAPESEATAELTFYLPDFKAYCGGEIVSRNLHNVYTLRGTKARDALKWSRYIDEAIELFAEAEIYFGTHHWPVWGREQVAEFLRIHRDTYKYIHDQTLRMANNGMTPREIAEEIRLPDSLCRTFSNRDYYGTLRHNAKAVYSFYFGWYDGNPANLNPLPPEEAGTRYVEFMGGAERLLQKARASFDAGDYRWVAQVINHLVFAEPDNREARELLASAYDQLGYQSESGPWRDVYLTGALELRHGIASARTTANADELVRQMPIASFFDIMAVRLNGLLAAEEDLTINFIFTDRNESYVLRLKNGVLRHYRREPDTSANATLKLSHDLYVRIFTRQTTMMKAAAEGGLQVDGSTDDLTRFFSFFPSPDGMFSVVTP